MTSRLSALLCFSHADSSASTLRLSSSRSHSAAAPRRRRPWHRDSSSWRSSLNPRISPRNARIRAPSADAPGRDASKSPDAPIEDLSRGVSGASGGGLGADAVAAAYWYAARLENAAPPGDPDGPAAGVVLNGDRRANAATGSDPEEPPRDVRMSPRSAARLSRALGSKRNPGEEGTALAARFGSGGGGGGGAFGIGASARAVAAGDDTERSAAAREDADPASGAGKAFAKAFGKAFGASLPSGGGVGSDPDPTPTPIPTPTPPRSFGSTEGDAARDADADGAEAHPPRAAGGIEPRSPRARTVF